jgi:hypothetical protein
MTRDHFTILSIYDRPEDHPGHVVLASWCVGPGGDLQLAGQALCDTLDEARAVALAAGYVCIGRTASDHVELVESWV